MSYNYIIYDKAIEFDLSKCTPEKGMNKGKYTIVEMRNIVKSHGLRSTQLTRQELYNKMVQIKS